MLKSRVKLACLSLLAAIIAASPAISGDWKSNGHRHMPRERGVIGSNGLLSVLPGIGTYVGSISAVRIKGNGVFVAVDRGAKPSVIAYRAPKARIIEVSSENLDEACRFEAGVCVIRPKK